MKYKFNSVRSTLFVENEINRNTHFYTKLKLGVAAGSIGACSNVKAKYHNQ